MYLRFNVEDGNLVAEIVHRVKQLKKRIGARCHRWLKGKHMTVVIIIYGSDTCAVKKPQERKLDVMKTKILRRCVKSQSWIRKGKEGIRVTTKAGEIAKQVPEIILK